MSHEIELLTEIRDLLQVMAEPALAKRDAKLRASLRTVVGGSGKKVKAVLLMDGSRSQSAIVKESGIDQGNLSRLMKALAAAQLITADEKHPRLSVRVPANLFDRDDADE
jgi:DNA-binding MarR family transcriptional regulator